jgi:PAS domain S-box-containing protein
MANIVQHSVPEDNSLSPRAGQTAPFHTAPPEQAAGYSAHEGIWITDAGLATTFVNSRMTTLLGYRNNEMMGRPIADFVDPASRTAITAMLARLPGSTAEQTEVCLLRRDGAPLFAIIDLRALFTTGTEFTGVRASIIDVTAQRAAEEQLKVRQAQLEQARTLAHLGTWEWDLDRNVITCSEEMCRLLNVDPHGEPQPFDAAVNALEIEHREEMIKSFRAAAVSDEPIDYQVTLRTPDGERRVLRGRVQRECDFRGRPVRVVGMVQDITEQKHLEGRLKQAERMSSLGRLAASVAHEFNNILMSIQSFAEMILRESTGDARIYASAARIADSVSRGKRVTQEILRFTHTPEPVRAAVEVASWLAEGYAELVQVAGANIAIAIEAEAGMHVLADPQQLRQVFTNFVTNARDAMPRGGTITIRATRESGRGKWNATELIHFTIADDGTGMSPETLRLAFEPLFTTKHTGGTGLGLSIAQRIVQLHEGELWVNSVLGAGSTFHVLVPSAAADPLPRPPIEVAQSPAEPLRKLLLVEDDPAVAMGLATLLEMDEIEVSLVSRGADTVTRIEAFAPDAVVLDVGLPDISGIAVYEQIARRWPSLPVLFSTGSGDEKLLTHVLARQNVGYLQKPYDGESLIRALGRLRGG